MNALVSIIIPIFNVEQYLSDTISSACKQTYKNLEIILVNDGSTDNSLYICNEFSLKDQRIIIINKKNGGLSSARNAGINIATGEYLFFLDGDDFIEIDTIDILYKSFNNNPQVGIVSAPCFYSYNNGKREIYRKKWEISENRLIIPKSFCIETLLQKSCHSACCKLYKRELFEELRFREGKKNEDTLFMFDLSNIMREKDFTMLEIPNKFYYYRVNDNSITQNTYQPIQVDIIENLIGMTKETNNPRVIKTLKVLFYNEIIYHYPRLTDCNKAKNISPYSLNRINNIFSEIRIKDILYYSSIKNFIKFILLKHFRSFYNFFFNIKNK